MSRSWIDNHSSVSLRQHLIAFALQQIVFDSWIMDLYSDSSVELMWGFSLAGALVDPGPPPAAPPAAPAMDDFGPPPAATAGYGYVVPSLGMAPMRMPIPPLVVHSTPYSDYWHATAQHSSVYVSAPMSGGPRPNFSGPRMSLASPVPGSVEDLLARRAALD